MNYCHIDTTKTIYGIQSPTINKANKIIGLGYVVYEGHPEIRTHSGQVAGIETQYKTDFDKSLNKIPYVKRFQVVLGQVDISSYDGTKQMRVFDTFEEALSWKYKAQAKAFKKAQGNLAEKEKQLKTQKEKADNQNNFILEMYPEYFL